MSNESVNQDVKQDVAVDSEKNPSITQDDKMNMIPQTRFNEVLGKNKEMAEKIAKYEAEQEEARKKKMEEEGNYKQIIDELKVENVNLKDIASKYEKEKSEERELLLNELSDDEKPIYGELSNTALRQHLKTKTGTTKVKTDTRQPLRSNGIDVSNWTQMDDKERKKNWTNIVSSYINKK